MPLPPLGVEQLAVLASLCSLIRLFVSAPVQSPCPSCPPRTPFLFPSGSYSTLPWVDCSPISRGRQRDCLWGRTGDSGCVSGARGTTQGFGTLMLVILLCPLPSQDFASLWSDCGAKVTSLTDSLLKSPIVLCACTHM